MSNVSSSNLPGCGVVSEEEEHGSEPVVNLIQSALFVWRLQNRLQTARHREKHARTVRRETSVIQCADK